jgi:uncharacterized protein YggE
MAVLALGLVAAPAPAQFFTQNPNGLGGAENIDGLTVAGKGVVAAKPNLAEIDLDVSAASELTADAIVKYRDARKRLRDAFASLKLANVTVGERGLLVDQKGMQMPYYWGGQMNTRSKTEVQLTRKLVVRAADIRKLDEDAVLQLVGKLLDVAQDAGGHVGGQREFNPYYYNPYDRMSNGLVRFVLDDFDKLQEEAYDKAIADARTRAERLARLAKVELGPVVAIREQVVPGEQPAGAQPEAEARKRLESQRFQDIPVRVELLVRFEVHAPRAAGSARVGGP